MRVSLEAISNIIDNSENTLFRAIVNNAVMKRFRSEHLLSSKLISDSIVATLAFTENIEPSSVDKFVTCVYRRTRSMYVTVNSAYIPVEDRFIEYAKSVLHDYESVRALGLRPTNFIVYVIAYDLSKNSDINRMELFYKTYKFNELRRKTPKFD